MSVPAVLVSVVALGPRHPACRPRNLQLICQLVHLSFQPFIQIPERRVGRLDALQQLVDTVSDLLDVQLQLLALHHECSVVVQLPRHLIHQVDVGRAMDPAHQLATGDSEVHAFDVVVTN